MALSMLECLESSLPVEEKFKKLNRISKRLTAFEADEASEALKTNHNYDQIRLKLADDFKQSACMLDILENGNRQSISRAVKLPWMYADGSELINAEFLVTSFFPRVSFSTRLKIINNLGRHLRNRQTADHVFTAIESKYGFKIASAMLQACSEKVFTNFLMGKKHHELSSSQLLHLLKTSPQLGLDYLKGLFANTEYARNDVSSSLKYLLDHRPNEALKLMIEYPSKWDFSVGRRRFKKLRNAHDAEILKILDDKCHFLKQRELRSFLSLEQYEKAFLKPSSDLKSSLTGNWGADNLWQWLDHLPKSRQQALLRSSFKVVFNKEISECPQYVTPDMFLLLSEEEKSAVLDWKLENASYDSVCCRLFTNFSYIYCDTEWFWRSMKPTKNSIPELTKILNSEKDHKKRSHLFTLLVMTCIFNKDTEQFTNVLQLLTGKSRNDHSDLRENLLALMNESTLHVELEEKHWACFQELFQFVQLYKEVNNNSSVILDLLGKYAAFHQKYGKPYDEELNLIIKITMDTYPRLDISFIKEPMSQRQMIESYIKALSAMPDNSDVSSTIHGYVKLLVEEILKWNKYHQKKFGPMDVSSYPWLERKCWEIIMKGDNDDKTFIFKLLKQGSGFKSDALDKFLNKDVCFHILYYCLKKHHDKIIDNLEAIVSNIVKKHSVHEFFTFVRKLKATYCWSLLEKIKEECNKIINQEDPKSVVGEISHAIRLLSILQPPSQFLDFASKHYPVDAKIDPSIPIDELDYRTKESVVVSLKYLPHPALLLPVVDKFLLGDYLKLALQSLYSICSLSSEEKALSYLQSGLKDRPVSVKKHMVRLYFLISPLDGKLRTLEEIWSAEKNVTIRYEILVQIYRMFEDMPTKEVWELLKSSIKTLTDGDKPSLDFVKDNGSIDEILDEFTTDFFQTILETFKGIGLYKKVEACTICRISRLVSKLDGGFLDSLIKELLPKTRISSESSYSQLVINYLMDESASLQVQDHRMTVIQDIIQDLFDHYWDSSEIDYSNTERLVFPTKTLVTSIVDGICASVLYSCANDKNISKKTMLHKFIKQLEGMQKGAEMFQSIIRIQLTLIAFEDVELEDTDRLRNFGKRIVPFLSLQTEKYGVEIACVINTILKEVIAQLLIEMDNENIIWIIDGLLADAQDRCQLIAAISLLPRKDEFSSKLLEIYERVITLLKSCSDTSVQIYFKLQQNADQIRIFNI